MAGVIQKMRNGLTAVIRRTRRARGLGLLSVVVPIYNVEDYLDECLDSIRGQRYRNIEIIIVDDGSPDGSLVIAERHARQDRRITIVRRSNGGLSAARNTGVEIACGDFLTFVDSDDTVTADGFAQAMESLSRSGSDIAVLKYQRIREGRYVRAARWIRELHAYERIGTNLAKSPDVMVNATAWAKVFRSDFWQREGLSFIEGMVYEDQPFTAQAYLSAHSIDVLKSTGYNWRIRETSISQGHVTAENLGGRLDAAIASLKVLADSGPIVEERALQILRYNMANSALKLERADEDYLQLFMDVLPTIVSFVPKGRLYGEVPVQFRVLYLLLCSRRDDCVRAYIQAEGMQLEMHPTGLEPAGLTAYLPGWDDGVLPAEGFVLCDDQTPFKAQIQTFTATRQGTLTVELEAYIQNIDFERIAPTLTAALVGHDCRVVIASSDHAAIVESRQGAQRRYAKSGWTLTMQDCDRSAPVVELDIQMAAGPIKRSKRLQLDLRPRRPV